MFSHDVGEKRLRRPADLLTQWHSAWWRTTIQYHITTSVISAHTHTHSLCHLACADYSKICWAPVGTPTPPSLLLPPQGFDLTSCDANPGLSLAAVTVVFLWKFCHVFTGSNGGKKNLCFFPGAEGTSMFSEASMGRSAGGGGATTGNDLARSRWMKESRTAGASTSSQHQQGARTHWSDQPNDANSQENAARESEAFILIVREHTTKFEVGHLLGVSRI